MLSQSINGDLASDTIGQFSIVKNKFKAAEFIIYPNRLISLIIESKKSEAIAIVELKRMKKKFDKLYDIQGNLLFLYCLAEKENYIRQLEDEISQNQAAFSKDTREFSTFGNSKSESRQEMNIIDDKITESAYQELQAQYNRRIKELENQVEEFHHKEQQRLDDMISHNGHKIKEFRDHEVFDDESFAKAALDAIWILSHELCELEIREYSKKSNLSASNADQSLMVLQSHRSFHPAPSHYEYSNGSVEICQRAAIKYLSKTLTRLLTNNQNIRIENTDSFIPNNEGDRAVWYLELLESQLGKFRFILSLLI